MNKTAAVAALRDAPHGGPSDSHAAEQLRALNDFVVSCPELRELEKLVGTFNLFRVLRFEYGEIRHSNVLSWLLKPDEAHGLRDLFLRRWLMRVLHGRQTEEHAALEAADIESVEIREVQVRREWWNIDLLIQIKTFGAGEWIVAVENKVRAKQYEGQLLKYRERVEHTFKHAQSRLYVFLTRSGEEAEDPNWITTTYAELHAVLSDCVSEQRDVMGAAPRVLVEHYLKILEENLMENTKIAELARQIYRSHSRALDIIFQHRPDPMMRLTEEIELLMKEDSSAMDIIPMYTEKGYVRFLPASWNTKENRRGHEWHKTLSAYVLCELDLLWRVHPRLLMVECGAPPDWRNALWKMAQIAPFQKVGRKSRQPDQWMPVYTVQAPMEYDEADLEELEHLEHIAEEIWKWCKQAMDEPTYTESAKIISQHLRSLPKS